MKLTISTLLLTLLTVSAHPLQPSSISGTPCSLVNCKSACLSSPEMCDAMCQGDEDLPLCAIGTSPPHGIPQNHTTPNQRKGVARVQPPSRLSMPTPYCSQYDCINLCDPCWKGWPEEFGMGFLCATRCNDNQYIPMCPEGVVPVYKDA